MAWPTTAVATSDLITAAQLNGLPVMIANSTLSGDAANIDFTSIPGHYAHLMFVCYLRSDVATTAVAVSIRINNDSGANYDYQFVVGQGAVATSGETFAATSARIATIPGNNAGANLFHASTITIPHYANSANNKSATAESGLKYGTATTNMGIEAWAAFWRSSAAITRVTVLPSSGNLRSGSRVTLYGLA